MQQIDVSLNISSQAYKFPLESNPKQQSYYGGQKQANQSSKIAA
jgi:hypothetical protein